MLTPQKKMKLLAVIEGKPKREAAAILQQHGCLPTEAAEWRSLCLAALKKKSATVPSRSDLPVAFTADMHGARRSAREAVWAHVFHDTIRGSVWLKDQSFSPGRWAVGYPYLYAMYRILNEVRPGNILELGLGQSTRMIAQYAAHVGARHIVVEHDPEWIAFFGRNFVLPPSTEVVTLPWEFVDFAGAKGVRRFHGFAERFAGRAFDFLSIDAPFGGDMREFARIDVLQSMPGCLAGDFVIMLDDVERTGERHTLALMEETLKQANIAYVRGVYRGEKETAVLASQSLRFVASM